MDLAKFIEAVDFCGEGYESEIDTLCLRWLKDAAKDSGKEGEQAQALLDQVAKLLEIYV